MSSTRSPHILFKFTLAVFALLTGAGIGCGDDRPVDEPVDTPVAECEVVADKEIGASCGTCDLGTWTCSQELELECDADPGDAALNACGGCQILEEAVDASCGRCDTGTWQCDGLDTLSCEGEADASVLNECGGCEPLVNLPGELCGTCDSGAFACDEGTTTCQNDQGELAFNVCGGCGEPELNECGGCEPLGEVLGELCGTCDSGAWACSEGAAACEGDLGELAVNECGECGEPVLNECGLCGELELNACGGCATLEGEPDTFCGTCTTARTVCENLDTLVCVGAEHCDYLETCEEDDDCPRGHCSAGQCAPDGYEFAPAATFTMGAPPSEPGFHSGRENGQHEVTLTRSFFAKATTVTQGEWFEILGTRPAYFQACGDDCPVERVNWWEMLAYANALSISEGLPACYNLQDCTHEVGTGCLPGDRDGGQRCSGFYCSLDALALPDPACPGYRLPTEAEWEYMARAGTSTAYLTESGNFVESEIDQIAWYRHNSGVSHGGGVECSDWYEGALTCGTHPVAQKAPNNWGLYDMTGNVWEHVWDWSADYPEPGSSVTDPTGAEEGTNRRMRGGAFDLTGQYLRVAYRTGPAPVAKFSTLGFRLVRLVPEPTGQP